MKSLILTLLFVLSLISTAHAKPAPRGLALIYVGPTIDDGCIEAMAKIAHERGYRVKLVHPGEIKPRLLARAAVFMLPGGDDIEHPWQNWTEEDRLAIRAYVRAGGRYWGVCLGGYWAGREGTWPSAPKYFKALDIIPAVVRAHSPTPEDRIEAIRWHDGRIHYGYFQDGPHFVFSQAALGDPRTEIYGYYKDGTVAAFETTFGKGRVAVSGVHWEATPDWYKDIEDRLHPGHHYDLEDPEPGHRRLAFEMFDDLMAEGGPKSTATAADFDSSSRRP